MDQVTWDGRSSLKAEAVANLEAHRAEKTLGKGYGYMDPEGRGCALGCTIIWADLDREYELRRRYGVATWTELIAAHYRLPRWVAALEEGVFEQLDSPDAPDWPVAFVSVVPVGWPFVELDAAVHDPLTSEFPTLTDDGGVYMWPYKRNWGCFLGCQPDEPPCRLCAQDAYRVRDRALELLRPLEDRLPGDRMPGSAPDGMPTLEPVGA